MKEGKRFLIIAVISERIRKAPLHERVLQNPEQLLNILQGEMPLNIP